jgi:hypothetical protein
MFIANYTLATVRAAKWADMDEARGISCREEADRVPGTLYLLKGSRLRGLPLTLE